MKTKSLRIALVIAGSAIVFADSIVATDSVTNSISQANEPLPLKIIVAPKKNHVHIGEHFEVQVSAQNTTKSNLLFGVMLCSWPEHYRTDNPNVPIVNWFACTRNFPIRVNLAPNESFVKTLTLEVVGSVETNRASFRIGFQPLIVGKGIGGPYFDAEPGNIHWSEQTTLEINPKLIPDWIPW